jgi:hypothetical protein
MIMGRAVSPHRSPFQIDERAALSELEQAWTSGGYHGLTADGGTWCAITSAGAGADRQHPGRAGQGDPGALAGDAVSGQAGAVASGKPRR